MLFVIYSEVVSSPLAAQLCWLFSSAIAATDESDRDK